MISAILGHPFGRPLAIGLWFGLLLLPFKGLAAALLLAAAVGAATAAARFSAAPVSHAVRGTRRAWSAISSGLEPYRKHFLFLLLPAAIYPYFAKGYVVDVAILACIYIILALGLNVIVGFAGLLNLGFVAFYAIGAYTYALLDTRLGLGFWGALPLSVLLTTLSGFVLAIPALRLRGDYLAIVTLGFGEIVRLVLNNWDSFTKGPNGISDIAPASIFSFRLDRPSDYYILVLLFVCAAIFVIRRVESSRTGRAWVALREDEIAASAMGISRLRYKLYACAFGAFWAGIAGCLFAAKMRFVSPESFTFMESVFILCMVILGGLGSIPGVVLGALVLVCLPEALREVQLYRMLATGAGLVALMVFRPQGLFGGKDASGG